MARWPLINKHFEMLQGKINDDLKTTNNCFEAKDEEFSSIEFEWLL